MSGHENYDSQKLLNLLSNCEKEVSSINHLLDYLLEKQIWRIIRTNQ